MSSAHVLPRLTRLQSISAPGVSLALIAIVLIGFTTFMSTTRTPTVRLGVDGREAALLSSGFHAIEQDGAQAFRWTTGESRLSLTLPVRVNVPVLILRLGAPAPGLASSKLTLDFNGRQYARFDADQRPRAYRILIPQEAFNAEGLEIRLASATVVVPPDTRIVGMRFVEAALDARHTSIPWPAPILALTQLVCLGMGALLLHQLGASAGQNIGGILALAIGLAIVPLTQPLLAEAYIRNLAVALTILVGLTTVLRPPFERLMAWAGPPEIARALWVAAMLACAIRLAGALYPLYSAHDLPLNAERLIRTLTGMLVSTNRSFEFRSGVTIYPPGPYLVLLPGLLPGMTPRLLVQSGISLLDGLSALGVGALALGLGLNRRIAFFGTLLYAAMPISLTSLWWGHSAQIFGQALMPPLALVLVLAIRRPRPALWIAASILLSMALLTHIGVSILAVIWLGLVWAAVLARNELQAAQWRRLTLALAVAGLAGLTLVYGPAAQLKLDQTAKVGERVLSGGYSTAGLIVSGLRISYYAQAWPALIPGVLLLFRQHLSYGSTTITGTWIVTATIFLIIELLTGLQVRYMVFLTPLACIALGTLLDGMAARGPAGKRAAWIFTILLLAQGSIYWYTGVFADIQMSMVPLLR